MIFEARKATDFAESFVFVSALFLTIALYFIAVCRKRKTEYIFDAIQDTTNTRNISQNYHSENEKKITSFTFQALILQSYLR